MIVRALRFLFQLAPALLALLSYGLISTYEHLRDVVPSPGFPHRYKGLNEVFFASDTDVLILRAFHGVLFIVAAVWAAVAIRDLLRRRAAATDAPPP